MKTKIISKLKKELLIIELPEKWEIISHDNGIMAVNDSVLQWEIEGSYTLLGTLDEIKEEDVSDFVKQSIFTSLYGHYISGIDVNTYCYKTALQSFNSALESEIFWDFNPLQSTPPTSDIMFYDSKAQRAIAFNKWYEAQEKTFDKKRTLIFTKNERQDN